MTYVPVTRVTVEDVISICNLEITHVTVVVVGLGNTQHREKKNGGQKGKGPNKTLECNEAN
jgi:hypothetical protein